MLVLRQPFPLNKNERHERPEQNGVEREGALPASAGRSREPSAGRGGAGALQGRRRYRTDLCFLQDLPLQDLRVLTRGPRERKGKRGCKLRSEATPGDPP